MRRIKRGTLQPKGPMILAAKNRMTTATRLFVLVPFVGGLAYGHGAYKHATGHYDWTAPYKFLTTNGLLGTAIIYAKMNPRTPPPSFQFGPAFVVALAVGGAYFYNGKLIGEMAHSDKSLYTAMQNSAPK